MSALLPKADIARHQTGLCLQVEVETPGCIEKSGCHIHAPDR